MKIPVWVVHEKNIYDCEQPHDIYLYGNEGDAKDYILYAVEEYEGDPQKAIDNGYDWTDEHEEHSLSLEKHFIEVED